MANIGYMQVVRHCNQYCRFCSNPETPFILDLDTAKRQIDDFAARGYFGIILTGGEPSLSDNIPAIVEYALEKGLYPRMITNGQRLSRRSLAETYVRAGLRHFHVSIHSCKPEIEDFLTGTENSHERAMQALENLSDLGATVNINTVINRYNADHLDKTVEFFVGRFPFLRHFVWNNLDPSMGRADTNRDTAPRLGDFEVALHRAMRFLHDSGRTFRVERVPLCYMAEFAWASTETRKIVKGEERMVHFLDEKGTVRQTDFRHLKAPACAQCSFDSICGGLFELGNHYDPGELSPVFLPVEPVIKRILEEPDMTEAPAPAPAPDAASLIQDDAPLASRRLLLVLTHACNLRCRYCHEIKDESRMPIEIARRALDLYAAASPPEPTIKLFGGEPTLNRDVLATVLSEARARLPGVRFELTTNGTLLDDALLDLIETGGDVELHVSLDGTPGNHEENRRIHLPVEGGVYNAATRLAPRLVGANAIVNLTIAPWTAAGVAADLDHLCSLGFRRFNLLPAYYMAWTDEQLGGLRRSFEEIERRVAASWKDDAKGDAKAGAIDLTNLDVQAMYTFFNDGLVVDVDGDVFQTNLFLWRPFDGLRARLRRGNIAGDPASWRPHPPATEVDRWIQDTATPSTLGSTAAVDRELTRLCERLLVRRSKLTSRTARRPGRRGLAGRAVPS